MAYFFCHFLICSYKFLKSLRNGWIEEEREVRQCEEWEEKKEGVRFIVVLPFMFTYFSA